MTDVFPTGSQQSPIKIETANTIPVQFPTDYLVIDYPNESLVAHLNHQDHNFYFEAPPQIQFDGRSAPLERIHIHSRSEHWLSDQGIDTDFDFEIHFVHPLPSPSDPTTGTGASTHVVFGVFFKETENASTPSSIRSLNDGLKSKLKSNMTQLEHDETPITANINPLDFMPANRALYFRYEGSLTTPSKDNTPNSEIVSWIVYPDLVEVDPADVAELKAYAQEDARVLQPINRRFILRNSF